MLTGPREGVTECHPGLRGTRQVSVTWQKTGGEGDILGQRFLGVSMGKVKEGKVHSSGWASLNNFHGLQAIGVVSFDWYLALGPEQGLY